jgi:outer membrane protein assembly factor BamC
MFTRLSFVLLALSLSGCMSLGGSEDEKKTPLGESTVSYDSDNQSLTIPPDLTNPEISDIVPLMGADSSKDVGILVSSEGIQVVKKGQRRWLVVNKDPEDVWDLARGFLKAHGFAIKKTNKKIGLLETESLPRGEEIPDESLGIIRSLLKSALKTSYSLPIVDKYRIRIEPSDDGLNTEIYLSLSSMEEVLTNEGKKSENRVWQSHPKDYELETEMLYRLMIFLGSDEAKAKEKFLAEKEQQGVQVELAESNNGYAKLVFPMNEQDTWKSVGWALDELNIDIEDKDIKERSFYVELGDTEEGSFLSNLFVDKIFNRSFQILVRQSGDNLTEVYFNDLSEKNEKEIIDFSHEFLGNIAQLF